MSGVWLVREFVKRGVSECFEYLLCCEISKASHKRREVMRAECRLLIMWLEPGPCHTTVLRKRHLHLSSTCCLPGAMPGRHFQDLRHKHLHLHNNDKDGTRTKKLRQRQAGLLVLPAFEADPQFAPRQTLRLCPCSACSVLSGAWAGLCPEACTHAIIV